jgi:hypothetical protein
MSCSASIPALAGFASDFRYVKYWIVLLGVTLVILEAAQSIWKFHEHWMSYRQTAENLIREHQFWETKSGPYAETPHPDQFQTLVERTESIIAHEVSDWTNRTQRQG